MQLPVDIKTVFEEATKIDEARNTALSVSVYFDDTAPGDIQAHVRQAFASASSHARVSLIYLDGRPFTPYAGDDMAVIVAGFGNDVGACAAQLRKLGVPVMVVTTFPLLVGEIARENRCSIPQGDLIYPSYAQDALEPLVLDEGATVLLSDRMGEWVLATCRQKRLAFAMAFPFVRKPLATEIINATALQNAGVGFLVIIPGADMPVMTLNQAKMLLMIAAAYGENLDAGRIKELAALVGGAFACRAVSRQVATVAPVLGWAVKAAVGYTGTVAMGRAAIAYYEGDALQKASSLVRSGAKRIKKVKGLNGESLASS